MIVALGGTVWGSANVNEDQQKSGRYFEEENQEALFLMEVLIDLANINDECISNLKESYARISFISSSIRELQLKHSETWVNGQLTTFIWLSELLESIYEDSIKILCDSEVNVKDINEVATVKARRYKNLKIYMYISGSDTRSVADSCVNSLSEDEIKVFCSRAYKNFQDQIDIYFEKIRILGKEYKYDIFRDTPLEDRANLMIYIYLSGRLHEEIRD